MALIRERLRALREKRNFTQEELAARTGIGLRLIQKYEYGENDPSLDNASKIAEALNTTTDYLSGRVADSAPYFTGDLSTVERFIVFLFRRRRMPDYIEAAINEAMSEELQQSSPANKQAARNPQS